VEDIKEQKITELGYTCFYFCFH